MNPLKAVKHKNSKSPVSTLHPHLWRWAAEFGTIEIGHCGQTGSFIRVLDEGGIVWKGHCTYRTLDAPRIPAESRPRATHPLVLIGAINLAGLPP